MKHRGARVSEQETDMTKQFSEEQIIGPPEGGRDPVSDDGSDINPVSVQLFTKTMG